MHALKAVWKKWTRACKNQKFVSMLFSSRNPKKKKKYRRQKRIRICITNSWNNVISFLFVESGRIKTIAVPFVQNEWKMCTFEGIFLCNHRIKIEPTLKHLWKELMMLFACESRNLNYLHVANFIYPFFFLLAFIVRHKNVQKPFKTMEKAHIFGRHLALGGQNIWMAFVCWNAVHQNTN